MRKEVRIFFTALMFYTRIPCPSWVDHQEDYLEKSTRYFPLIGWIVGITAAAVIYLCHFIFPMPVCVILSLATSVLVTGAFHEDGFADVCDGFGGGWTKEKILDIMKDSRVGAYGAVGIVILLLLKIATTVELLNINIWFALKAIVLAHVLSRFSAVAIIFTQEYARADETSKVKPVAKKISNTNFLISAIWVIPCFFLFNTWWVFLAIVPVYLMKMYLAYYFTKWIGGYTGDCLGATQQINELLTLLFCLGLCKFI